ncbi:fused MFS/spermidine synthase [Deltaproteobacteria bacterium]|nr:fused MFS/spermidine synthase [Deltaproteobacteria bacterium]
MYKVLLLPLFFISCLLVSSAIVRTEDEKVLYEGDSLYHHIRVSEVGEYRYLSFNRTRGNQSVVNILDPFELQFAYTRASFVVPAFLEGKPERILFIGLGGGSIPRVMAKYYPDAQIDIVEIDQDVIEVAKKYFFFETTPRMNIIAMDGRRFLRSCRDNYDIIFIDAYDDLSIPFHLTTREFFKIVEQRLTPKGVVASNVWGPRNNEFYLAEVKTYQQVFPHIYLIDAVSSSNYIVIAYSQNKAITKTILEERIKSLQRLFEFNFHLMIYGSTLEDLSSAQINAKVLLDDFAPVEVLRSRKAAF